MNYDDSTLGTDSVEEGGTASYSGATPKKPGDAQYSYTFTGWDKKLTNVTSSFSTKAQYSSATNSYTVTWENYDGTVLETDSNVAYGTVPTFDGGDPAKPGTAQHSYSFAGWSPAVVAVTGDATYTAQFSESANSYKLTVSSGDEAKGLVSGGGEYAYGSSVTVVASPLAGFAFTGWLDGAGKSVSSSSSYSFAMPANAISLTAIFAASKEADSLTFSSEKNKIGTEAFSPSETHSGNGQAVTKSGATARFSYSGLYNPTAVWQIFKAGGYVTNTDPLFGMSSLAVTKKSSDASVGVYWSSTKVFSSSRYKAYDSTTALEISCDFDGYQPNYIKIIALGSSNSSIESASIEFGNANQYPSLSLVASSQKAGSVSGAGVYKIETSVTITATPNDGYLFLGWYSGDVLISADSEYTFPMPSGDTEYKGVFNAKSYALSLASEDETKGSVSGSGTYQYGSTVAISATPTSGYTFAGWYSGTSLISLDSPYSFTMPKSEVSYVGHFAKLYHVDASSTDTTKGTVSGSGDYGEGLSVTLTASSIGFYQSVTWYDPSFNKVGTGLTYTFTMPSSDASYTADFSIGVGAINEFGSYPQTKLDATSDAALISTLNTAAGALPTSGSNQSWTDYGYYASGSVSSYMWYQDVTSGSDKYRGVYFASYRPYYCWNSSSADSSFQNDNGYSASTAYWFKYEPLKWRVLAVDGSKFFLMCDSLIDSQQYYHTSNGGTHWYNGSSVYENNYAASDIRSWLNASFYGLAFSEAEQAKILATTVDNSAATTYSSSNQFACEDTSDKVFLLSYKDATNSAYGLGSNDKRQLRNTDYAKCQGAYNYSTTGQTFTGCGYWWLRSPYVSSSRSARFVYCDGYAGGSDGVISCSRGVSPALWVSF